MTSQNASYKFKGWYTKASGGEKITSGVYPAAGVQVYYAQWDVESSGGGAPEPQNKYFTVFFDQNYDGGGIASELVGDTILTLTVTYDDGTQRTLVCHLLSLGFSFPNDPVREGYDFLGWSLKSDNSSGLVEIDIPSGRERDALRCMEGASAYSDLGCGRRLAEQYDEAGLSFADSAAAAAVEGWIRICRMVQR